MFQAKINESYETPSSHSNLNHCIPAVQNPKVILAFTQS